MSWARRFSTFLSGRPRLALTFLLAAPLGWLGLVYLGSLGVMLLQSFYTLDHYTGQVLPRLSFSSYLELFTPANLDIFRRTTLTALAVTVAAALLAFPLAYLMAFRASPRWKVVLYLAVVLPLWSSYLVRVYSWKLILAKEGILSWLIERLGLGAGLEALLALPGIGGPSLSISAIGIFLAFLYVWLPYMILPIQAALERVPRSLLHASEDLGARPRQTFRHVVLPLAFPGVVAGSIFTFSLTLGDFIVPSALGNSSFFIGQAILAHQGTSGNLPLAAAMTAVPMAVMAVYLAVARRFGAFDAL